jgi:hypothetical protein
VVAEQQAACLFDQQGIVVVGRDGSARRMIVRRRRIDQVKWSADGRELAFAVEKPDGFIDVYVKRLTAGRPDSVARSRAGRDLIAFDWSRGGRTLVVEDRDYRIGVLKGRNQSLHFVVNGDASYEPALSRDQRRSPTSAPARPARSVRTARTIASSPP